MGHGIHSNSPSCPTNRLQQVPAQWADLGGFVCKDRTATHALFQHSAPWIISRVMRIVRNSPKAIHDPRAGPSVCHCPRQPS